MEANATDEIVAGYKKAFGSDEFLIFPIYMQKAMKADYQIYIQNEIASITGWPLYVCNVHTPLREIYLEGIERLKKDCYELNGMAE